MRLSSLLLCLAFALLPALSASAQDDFSGLVRQKKNPATPALVANTGTIVAGKPFLAALQLKADPGWHTYWQFPGESGGATTIAWELPPGFTAGPIQWPIPKAHLDEGEMLTYIYDGEVLLLVEITPPATLPAGDITLKAHVEWLVCKLTCIPGEADLSLPLKVGEAPTSANADLFALWRAQLPKPTAPFPVKWDTTNPKELRLTVSDLPKESKIEFLPLPPEGATPGHPKVSSVASDGSRTITVPLGTAAKAGGTWRGLLVAQSADTSPREGWYVSADSVTTAEAPAGKSGGKGAKPVDGLLKTLMLAFLGGLVLNVMPCVLPVISLKIFGFMSQAGDDPKRVSRLGLAFVAGVFTFFLGIAAAVAMIRQSFSWGFQNTDPRSLAAMIALIFVFGLNLLGVFEITLASGATSTLSDLSSKDGYGGAFLHGLFTTLLGTSCTAPFLAPAVQSAITQPVPIIFLLFCLVAAGLSLPYFLLTQKPAWLKFVPKPGVWMERFKQIMGFIMLAYAVFLFTSFAGAGAEATGALAWFLLVLGFAAWLFGLISHASPAPEKAGQPAPSRWRSFFRQSNRRLFQTLGAPGYGATVALLLAVGGYFYFLHGKLTAKPAGETAVTEGGITWQAFSEEALESALKAGKPVFIDFTASWCINCKYYEKNVIAQNDVAAALREKEVVTFRADWSFRDPVVTKWLNKFERIGVPVYVLYRPGEAEPVVQDGLTRGGFLEELGKIRKP